MVSDSSVIIQMSGCKMKMSFFMASPLACCDPWCHQLLRLESASHPTSTFACQNRVPPILFQLGPTVFRSKNIFFHLFNHNFVYHIAYIIKKEFDMYLKF